jgi:hypothetical protein
VNGQLALSNPVPLFAGFVNLARFHPIEAAN